MFAEQKTLSTLVELLERTSSSIPPAHLSLHIVIGFGSSHGKNVPKDTFKFSTTKLRYHPNTSSFFPTMLPAKLTPRDWFVKLTKHLFNHNTVFFEQVALDLGTVFTVRVAISLPVHIWSEKLISMLYLSHIHVVMTHLPFIPAHGAVKSYR